MSEMHYEPVLRRSREDLELAFDSDDPSKIHDALISAAYWDADWKWAQDKCITFATSTNEMVRAGAAYALGLIAVFHATLDMETVVPILERMCQDPSTRQYSETSLEDIDHFIVKLKGSIKAERLPPDWRP